EQPAARIVPELGAATARQKDLRDLPCQVPQVLPGLPVEARLRPHPPARIELEGVALARLVYDGNQPVLGVVVEAERRPRLFARDHAVEVRVPEANVSVRVLR